MKWIKASFAAGLAGNGMAMLLAPTHWFDAIPTVRLSGQAQQPRAWPLMAGWLTWQDWAHQQGRA